MENRIILRIKSLQAPKLKTIALTKVINTTTRSHDEQEFNNMSVESGKKTLVKKSFWPVPSRGMVEQAKKHGDLRPQRGYQGYAFGPQRSRWPRIA